MLLLERIHELSADWETLEDGEKDYILGISRALFFAAKEPESRGPVSTGLACSRNSHEGERSSFSRGRRDQGALMYSIEIAPALP
jgi:hypothetical protein